MNKGTPHKEVYNAGIAMLKIAACFGVVSLHMGNGGFGRKLAVPIFVLITFYLSGHVILTHNKTALFNRIKRLALPYFSWGLIGFLCSATFSWKKLISQFCFGRATDIPAGHLYYLELCILLLVVLFVLVGKLRAKTIFLELNLLVALSLILQYSGVNYLAFGWMPYNAANTLGRFLEFAPYACVGLQFA